MVCSVSDSLWRSCIAVAAPKAGSGGHAGTQLNDRRKVSTITAPVRMLTALAPSVRSLLLILRKISTLATLARARSPAPVRLLPALTAGLASTLRVVCEVTAFVRGCTHVTLQLHDRPQFRNRCTRRTPPA